ncbi:alpha/beta fold hydrolase [Actinomadura sp. BRA 177]|uniref:alpha/beta fold hydrolase n=1 Tax=Actinomadura sp. BRA 177 TaxID=2745202 RepID=UPI0015962C31|nr:alpha/beta hydrolase [Actinomadura sp. BRA 177]NVI89054.1 alpha/beta hydrolase [Actinomadura sp. BRA 177]
MTESIELTPGRRGSVVVDGVAVAWERWPRPGAPCAVLVHGTTAHTAWWHHTVSRLADGYDVVAVDLSGHGDSGRRAGYDLDTWSREVLGVVDAVVGGPAVLVGHSIGGLVTAGAAAARPDAVRAMVLVDCVVTEPRKAGKPSAGRGGTVFRTVEEALGRFRLTPPQPVPDVRVLTYVAERSVRPVRGGWAWKADPAIFGALDTDRMTAPLADVRCPTAVVRGELSQLVPADAAAVLADLLGRPVAQYDVPNAYHHVMIDQGAPFGRLLRRALDELLAPVSAEQQKE